MVNIKEELEVDPEDTRGRTRGAGQMNMRGKRTAEQEAAAVEARREAHAVLLDGIEAERRAGGSIPCYGGSGLDALAWVDDRDEVQVKAAAECRACPVIGLCAVYVGQFKEAAGVWAGTTMKERVAAAGAVRRGKK